MYRNLIVIIETNKRTKYKIILPLNFFNSTSAKINNQKKYLKKNSILYLFYLISGPENPIDPEQ